MVALLNHYKSEHPDTKPDPEEAAAFTRRRATEAEKIKAERQAKCHERWKPQMRHDAPILPHNASDRLRTHQAGLGGFISDWIASDIGFMVMR
jgi:hypothetical protein